MAEQVWESSNAMGNEQGATESNTMGIDSIELNQILSEEDEDKCDNDDNVVEVEEVEGDEYINFTSEVLKFMLFNLYYFVFDTSYILFQALLIIYKSTSEDPNIQHLQ